MYPKYHKVCNNCFGYDVNQAHCTMAGKYPHGCPEAKYTYYLRQEDFDPETSQKIGDKALYKNNTGMRYVTDYPVPTCKGRKLSLVTYKTLSGVLKARKDLYEQSGEAFEVWGENGYVMLDDYAEELAISLADVGVGDKIKWQNQKTPFTVRARDDRYIVITRPLFGKVQYSIIDTKEMICGPDDWLFGHYDYKSTEDIQTCLKELREGKFEISHRYRADVAECIYGLDELAIDTCEYIKADRDNLECAHEVLWEHCEKCDYNEDGQCVYGGDCKVTEAIDYLAGALTGDIIRGDTNANRDATKPITVPCEGGTDKGCSTRDNVCGNRGCSKGRRRYGRRKDRL